MINLKQELQNYSAVDMDILDSSTSTFPENIRNSVVLYNKALENLRAGSEDIAIIELKKAVAMNPDFYEAMNLLGVCYLYIKENARASELFEKVIKAENNGITALRYLRMIKPDEPGHLQSSCKTGNTGKKPEGAASLIQKFMDTRQQSWKNTSRYILSFVTGAVIIVIISLIWRMPGKEVQALNDVSSTKPVPTPTVLNVNNSSQSTDAQMEELNERLKAANEEIEYHNSVKKLFEIESMVAANDYEAAADRLIMLKSLNYRKEDKERYDRLLKQVVPKAAEIVYKEGYSLYNRNKYNEAVVKLSKVEFYGNNWIFMPSALYNLGKSYMKLNDSTNALSTFKKVVERYPDSEYAGWARGKIKDLK